MKNDEEKSIKISDELVEKFAGFWGRVCHHDNIGDFRIELERRIGSSSPRKDKVPQIEEGREVEVREDENFVYLVSEGHDSYELVDLRENPNLETGENRGFRANLSWGRRRNRRTFRRPPFFPCRRARPRGPYRA